MKSEELSKIRALRICFICTLLISVFSCKQKMPAPPATENMELEKQYTAAYLSLHQDLYNTLSRELDSRKDPLIQDAPDINKSINTAKSADGQYSVFVNDKNQVIARKEHGDPSQDKVIYEETDKNFQVEVRLSSSTRYFFITSHDGTTAETRFLPADLSSFKPFLIQSRETGCNYRVEHFGSDIFWIITNKNAPNRKLMQAMVSHPEEKYWLPVVPNRDSIYLENFTLLDEKYIFILERYRPGIGIRIYDRDKNDEGAIRFKEPDGDLKLGGFDPEQGKILLQYSSVLSPLTFYEFDLKTKRLGTQKRAGIKNYNKADYSSEILWTKTSDGSRIPITLIYKSGLGKTDGSNPLLLSLDIGVPSEDPVTFNPAIISLLDRGFYIAKAFVRKGNAIADYLQCTDFLFSQKLSSSGLITGTGNGEAALAMERILNEHPELFKAVILSPASNQKNSDGPRNEKFREQLYPAIMVNCPAERDSCYASTLSRIAKLRKANTGEHIILVNNQKKDGKSDMSVAFLTFLLDQYAMNE